MPKSAKKSASMPSGVSMNPAGVGGTLAREILEEKPKAPEITELISDSEECDVLGQLISLQISINEQLKPLETAKQRCNDRIKDLIKQYGITEASYQGASLSYYSTTRHTLSKVKLLEAGVDMLTIQSCEDTSVSWALKITPAKP